MEPTKLENMIKNGKVQWLVFSLTPLLFLFPVLSLPRSQPAGVDHSDLRFYLVFLGLVIFVAALFLRRRVQSVEGIQRLQKYVVCWVVNEMIALVAVAGSMVLGELYFFLPFFLLSILLTITLPPRFEG